MAMTVVKVTLKILKYIKTVKPVAVLFFRHPGLSLCQQFKILPKAP